MARKKTGNPEGMTDNQWKFYVYQLIDPRDGEVFYIGKGSGNRMFQHERDFASGKIGNAAKSRKINSIRLSGAHVECKEVARFMNEDDAYAFEEKQIGDHERLTNITHNLRKELPIEKTITQTTIMLSRIKPFKEWLRRERPTKEGIAMYWRIKKELGKMLKMEIKAAQDGLSVTY